MIINVSADENPVIRKVDNAEKKIALTFDDGPHGKYTDEILDILDEYGIKATFFVVGVNCETHPEIVERELEEGHEVGNHTYSHPKLRKLSQTDLVGEIVDAEDVLFRIREYRPKLFRPPEGMYTGTVSKTLTRLDYTPILWSVDTGDWRGRSADAIAKTVLDNVKSGDIILCHDFITPKSNTARAMRIFIPELQRMGYKFVTVSDLLMSSAGDDGK